MGSIGSAIIILIVVTVWVVKALSAVLGNNDSDTSKQRKRRSLEDWDELQARRRAELAQQSRGHEPLEELRLDALDQGAGSSYGNTPDPSQMTMAQRIELARQRANQQQGGGLPQVDERAEALRRARERTEREVQQRRAMAQQQQQAQREQMQSQRAARERERRLAERPRLAEQRAKAEQEQLRQSRSRRQRTSSGAKQIQADVSAASAKKQSQMRAESYQRVHKGHEHAGPVVKRTRGAGQGVSIGPLNAATLRKAFILKELLDKPLALRNPQDDLLL